VPGEGGEGKGLERRKKRGEKKTRASKEAIYYYEILTMQTSITLQGELEKKRKKKEGRE